MREFLDLPAWVWMWGLVGTLWIAFKTMAYLRAGGPALVLPHYFAWVGTDAGPFRMDRDKTQTVRKDLLRPALFVVIALALVFVAVPRVESNLVVGWLGIAAMLCLLHFGLFDLLATFWNAKGYPVEPIMEEPWKATTLGDFWGNRWNRAFSRWARIHVFRPLVRRWGTAGGTLAGFLASGLAHEVAISLPALGGWGKPTLYFVVQAMGLLAQRRCHPLRCACFILTVVLVPAPLLFHVPFLENVFAPMTRFFSSLL